MSGTVSIHELLRASQVPHRIAADLPTRPPVRERAQVVICVCGDTIVRVMLPASKAVNLERLSSLTGGRDIRLARDDEESAPHSAELIFVDVRLALSREIVFMDSAGTTVAVLWADFARSVRPIVGDFAESPRDRVGAYRLSYRE